MDVFWNDPFHWNKYTGEDYLLTSFNLQNILFS
jgi:hypothetical protein